MVIVDPNINSEGYQIFFALSSASVLVMTFDRNLLQRRLDPGKETLEGFFQVGNQKEYQNVVIISFVHLEKVNIFCFMHKSVAQKLSLPCPFESQTLNSHKSANFKARDFSFWI